MIVSKKVVGAGVVGALAVTGAGVGVAQCNGPQTPTAITVPASIASDCSTDVGAALSTWLDGLPANSTVSMGGCYLINSTLHINSTTGLTVTGGAFHQTVAPQPIGPMILLTQNTGLTWTNLTEIGAFNGSNGGAGQEKDYGLELEANHGVSITHSSVSNVQGDFINLQAPFDVPATTDLNTNITISNDTFTNAGYHGITVESANGATFDHDTFSGMGTDAIDFEYDVYSSTFDAKGNATQAAQDNIAITNSTFAHFSNDFFAQLQGQLPGVQSQNVTIANNTIDAASPLVEVTGTNPYLTPKQYWNTGLTITNNKGLQPAISTHGGGAPGTEAAMQITAVVGLTIVGNVFPIDQPNAPYLSVLQAFENQTMTIWGNTFAGAYSVLQPGSSANTGTPCGNKYGVNGAQLDAACP